LSRKWLGKAGLPCHSAGVKKKTITIPSRSQYSVLRQICNLIPSYLVPKLAKETGVDKKARTFSPWSHLVSLIYAQLTHAIGLNDICDGLRLHSGLLVTLRAATPPSRNNLSHSNKERDASLAEKIFWSVLGHLQTLQPGFARGNRGKGIARRFRRVIHVVDSTTIQLVASCMDWAKHRRRKAAAKCHLRLDLHSFLPRFAMILSAAFIKWLRGKVLQPVMQGDQVLFQLS